MKDSGNATYRKKGFTLLEMVLVLAILSLIVGMIYNFIWSSLNQSKKLVSHIESNENVYYAMNFIEDEFLSAQEIWKIGLEGKTQYLICQFQGQGSRYKGHYLFYYLDRKGQLVRVAWKANYMDYKDFRPVDKLGKNVLCKGIKSFEITEDASQFRIKVGTDEGKHVEKVLAKRCPVKGS